MRWLLVVFVVAALLAPAACEACAAARAPIARIVKAKPVRRAVSLPVRAIRKHCTKGICR